MQIKGAPKSLLDKKMQSKCIQNIILPNNLHFYMLSKLVVHANKDCHTVLYLPACAVKENLAHIIGDIIMP